jgi:aryl-alcohol dehydrogenase-like predicted oxidoreductase
MIERRILGRTGFVVSGIGYGGWTIGNNGAFEYGDIDENEAIEVVKAYIEGGGNFIDTARNYGERSERIIGTVVSRHADRGALYIATKSTGGQAAETIPQIRKDLEESLRLLRTDYVDVFQLHQPPEDVDVMTRALDEMDALKSEGKIRAVGASIKGPDVTQKTVDLCHQYLETDRIDAIQLVYSILRQKMSGVIREAKARNVGIIARTVLESGLLTGKYKPGHRFSGLDQRRRYHPDHLEFILRTVRDLRKEAVRPPYQTLAQVAIRFSLEPDGVSTAIVGCHRPGEMRQNLETGALPELDPEIVDMLRSKYGSITEKANYA